jgi:hypothetical protein
MQSISPAADAGGATCPCPRYFPPAPPQMRRRTPGGCRASGPDEESPWCNPYARRPHRARACGLLPAAPARRGRPPGRRRRRWSRRRPSMACAAWPWPTTAHANSKHPLRRTYRDLTRVDLGAAPAALSRVARHRTACGAGHGQTVADAHRHLGAVPDLDRRAESFQGRWRIASSSSMSSVRRGCGTLLGAAWWRCCGAWPTLRSPPPWRVVPCPLTRPLIDQQLSVAFNDLTTLLAEASSQLPEDLCALDQRGAGTRRPAAMIRRSASAA